MGPVGWMFLGCSSVTVEPMKTAETTYTFNCWKPDLRDESTEQSEGMLRKDVVNDSRVKSVTVNNKKASLPDIVGKNMWMKSLDRKSVV